MRSKPKTYGKTHILVYEYFDHSYQTEIYIVNQNLKFMSCESNRIIRYSKITKIIF